MTELVRSLNENRCMPDLRQCYREAKAAAFTRTGEATYKTADRVHNILRVQRIELVVCRLLILVALLEATHRHTKRTQQRNTYLLAMRHDASPDLLDPSRIVCAFSGNGAHPLNKHGIAPLCRVIFEAGARSFGIYGKSVGKLVSETLRARRCIRWRCRWASRWPNPLVGWKGLL